MLTHKTRDFTIAHFKFNSTKTKATQANANETIKQLHFFITKLNHTQADAGALLQVRI